MTINEKEIDLSNYLKSSDLIKHYNYKVDRFYKPLNIEVFKVFDFKINKFRNYIKKSDFKILDDFMKLSVSERNKALKEKTKFKKLNLNKDDVLLYHVAIKNLNTSKSMMDEVAKYLDIKLIKGFILKIDYVKIKEFFDKFKNTREVLFYIKTSIDPKYTFKNLACEFESSTPILTKYLNHLNIEIHHYNKWVRYINPKDYGKIKEFYNSNPSFYFHKQTMSAKTEDELNEIKKRQQFWRNDENKVKEVYSKVKNTISKKSKSDWQKEANKGLHTRNKNMEKFCQEHNLKPLNNLTNYNNGTIRNCLKNLNITPTKYGSIRCIPIEDYDKLISMLDKIKPNGVSSEENMLSELLLNNVNSDEISRNNKSIIHPYEIDFYLSKLNLGFEFNGLFWHCDIHKDEFYHFKKYEICKNKGIKLIQFYEDELINEKEKCNNIIKMELGLLKEINVFDCELKVIDYKTADLFMKENSLIFDEFEKSVAVYFENSLICVIYIKHNEIISIISKIGIKCINVIDAYMKTNNLNEIIVYNDLRLGNEQITNHYEFLEYVYPKYQYCRRGVRYYDLEDKEKFNSQINSTDKYEILKLGGYAKIFDCGKEKIKCFIQ